MKLLIIVGVHVAFGIYSFSLIFHLGMTYETHASHCHCSQNMPATLYLDNLDTSLFF